MGDNTTKFILHVDNETGQVVKAEKEDPTTGELTEASGNWTDLTMTSQTSKEDSSVMNWVTAPQPEEDESDTAPKV
mgnify:CR=1 FL=1